MQATLCAKTVFKKTKAFHLPDQVQEEISRVTGSRQVQVKDRKNLPFTNAVIHETQRVANITPMAIPHKTTQDVTIQGHLIKKVQSNKTPKTPSVLRDKMVLFIVISSVMYLSFQFFMLSTGDDSVSSLGICPQ